MKTHNFIIIIYSVLTKGTGWQISKNISFEDYKSKLFSPERLAYREMLFKNITLPSLTNLPQNSTVLIFVSDEMPVDFRKRIASITDSYSNIKFVDVGADDNVFVKIGQVVMANVVELGGDVLYSSIRLDDDDAISRNFFKKLDKYLKREFAGVCISFSSGVGIILENNRVQSVHIKKYPKIAIGLTWINFYDSAKKSFF